MTLLDAIIFGIVEGISEFLPISSTAHLILTAKVLKLSQTNFVKSFEIAIQLGAILAVIVLYGKKFLVRKEILQKIFTAFLPTAVLGFIFYKIIKNVLMSHDQVILWALFLGGVFLIIFDLLHKEKDSAADDISKISYRQAFIIGVFQSMAMVPGVSRAAATIIGGLIMGIKRRTIVEFSFLLAVPTMLAATGLDLLKNAETFSSDQFILLAAGFTVSFVVALASIKFLLHFIKTQNFVSFGIYRVILALGFWFVF